jgi:molybdopterin synthase sulfur carrier subunit
MGAGAGMATIVAARGLQTETYPLLPMSASAPDSAGPSVASPTVRVRLFAALREAMGWSEQQVAAVADPATPLALWNQLDLAGAWLATTGAPAGAAPAGEGLPAGIRVAINQQFAEVHTPLADGDELAFLPPISGG